MLDALMLYALMLERFAFFLW